MAATQEIRELGEEYKAGKMEWIRTPLAQKIQKYAGIITAYAAKLQKQHPALSSDVCLEIAVNNFFIQHKTVDPRHEITAQLDEIKLEIYYRQTEAGQDLDDEKIMKEWRNKHSAFWRDHNIMRIIYFFEQNKQAYLDVLRQAASQPSHDATKQS